MILSQCWVIRWDAESPAYITSNDNVFVLKTRVCLLSDLGANGKIILSHLAISVLPTEHQNLAVFHTAHFNNEPTYSQLLIAAIFFPKQNESFVAQVLIVRLVGSNLLHCRGSNNIIFRCSAKILYSPPSR